MSNEHLDDALGIMRKLRPGMRCVVSHEDAGGQCERPATMTVWSLEFCELHGREAEESAFEEITEGAAVALEALTDAERSRLDSNKLIVHALACAEIPGRGVGATRSHVDAIRDAYPPVEGRVDAETLAYETTATRWATSRVTATGRWNGGLTPI